MAEADYSHIRKLCLPGFAKRLDDGWHPYDEYLFDTLKDISPPLLDAASIVSLRRYFWPPARSRGRPRKEPIGRLELARMIASTRRRGPAGTIARYLHARLLADTPHSILPHWSKFKKFQDRQFFRAVIKHLSDEFRVMLANGPPYSHTTLGELDFGSINPNFPPRVRRLKATQFVMRSRLALYPPAMLRMANIASEWTFTRWDSPPKVANL